MGRKVALLALVATLTVAAAGCGPLGAGGPGPVRVPSALPADVPLPERAVLRTARDQGHRGITLVFETEASLAEADGRLRARLQAAGWELLSEAAVKDAVFTSFRKPGRIVAVGVSRVGGVTVVGVSHGPAGDEEGDQG